MAVFAISTTGMQGALGIDAQLLQIAADAEENPSRALLSRRVAFTIELEIRGTNNGFPGQLSIANGLMSDLEAEAQAHIRAWDNTFSSATVSGGAATVMASPENGINRVFALLPVTGMPYFAMISRSDLQADLLNAFEGLWRGEARPHQLFIRQGNTQDTAINSDQAVTGKGLELHSRRPAVASFAITQAISTTGMQGALGIDAQLLQIAADAEENPSRALLSRRVAFTIELEIRGTNNGFPGQLSIANGLMSDLEAEAQAHIRAWDNTFSSATVSGGAATVMASPENGINRVFALLPVTGMPYFAMISRSDLQADLLNAFEGLWRGEARPHQLFIRQGNTQDTAINSDQAVTGKGLELHSRRPAVASFAITQAISTTGMQGALGIDAQLLQIAADAEENPSRALLSRRVAFTIELEIRGTNNGFPGQLSIANGLMSDLEAEAQAHIRAWDNTFSSATVSGGAATVMASPENGINRVFALLPVTGMPYFAMISRYDLQADLLNAFEGLWRGEARPHQLFIRQGNTQDTAINSDQAVTGKGDPHLVNMLGQRFDLYQPGIHVLLQVPRRAKPQDSLLRVEADARRMGAACADLYFRVLNFTGSLSNQTAGFQYFADKELGSRDWRKFGAVDLKVVRGSTLSGIAYLNVFARHLGSLAYPVGGLLGEDDHTAAATAGPECSTGLDLHSRRPAVASFAITQGAKTAAHRWDARARSWVAWVALGSLPGRSTDSIQLHIANAKGERFKKYLQQHGLAPGVRVKFVVDFEENRGRPYAAEWEMCEPPKFSDSSASRSRGRGGGRRSPSRRRRSPSRRGRSAGRRRSPSPAGRRASPSPQRKRAGSRSRSGDGKKGAGKRSPSRSRSRSAKKGDRKGAGKKSPSRSRSRADEKKGAGRKAPSRSRSRSGGGKKDGKKSAGKKSPSRSRSQSGGGKKDVKKSAGKKSPSRSRSRSRGKKKRARSGSSS
ncbi:unnamed protein product [Prorocentrum cordatum]|uniref:Uncharacterized protein n=1 Tax=Prorocentrum cordatum TaxID=2364126 RepID=A0ABN9UJS6_9DINO|nr:unnamed protein product [Polarella glacialis]